jgi:hypothetical protein
VNADVLTSRRQGCIPGGEIDFPSNQTAPL